MQLLLNQSVINLKESATLAINQKVKQLRQENKTVYHFGFGQSPFSPHPKVQQAFREAANHSEYAPTIGLYELRQKWVKYYKKYGYQFLAENTIVGPGSKELIYHALLCLQGPLILPGPSWVSYHPQSVLCNKPTHIVQTKKENGYKLQKHELLQVVENLSDYPQKILLLNNPNNPTGSVYTDHELKSIAEVCRNHNIIILSDEIYVESDYSGTDFKGFSQHAPERTIVTGGLSKGHGAGGYRLGFLSAPSGMEALINGLRIIASETFSSVNTPTQMAALMAYEPDWEITNYLDQCKSIHKAAGHYLYKRFVNMGLTDTPKPQGGFYLMIDFMKYKDKLLENGITNDIYLSLKLLESYSVATLPGSDFYNSENNYSLRIASVDYEGDQVYKKSLETKIIDDNFIETYAPNLKKGADKIEDFINWLQNRKPKSN